MKLANARLTEPNNIMKDSLNTLPITNPPPPVTKSMIVIISFIFLGGTCFMHVGSFLRLLKIDKK